ncbi:outer membrane protein OmpW [Serratia sp. M24T3]|uniref:Outer membrane protein W n=1 Tax=Rouxiella sp. WC2420 TaxID=3234145 RepID=A0AB39VN37_9GAMM|nr:outer membrane protein OmpW [Serratia sp. M24T3]EIC85577.1 outer membrane protein W [Serratia sp. M24T3]
MKAAYWALLAAAALPTVASANQAGDVIVRVGTATVVPSANSPSVLGSLGSFHASNNTQMGLTLGYMWTDNIGMELLAATPFKHKIGLRSTGTIASVRQLPPTLMAQYYFGSKEDKLRPYLGAGVNYTNFYGAHFNQTGKDAGLSDLSMSNSWGFAGQAGVDYNIDKNWLVNASVWWMDINSKAKFKAGEDQQSVHTQLNPWVFMFAVGYRF